MRPAMAWSVSSMSRWSHASAADDKLSSGHVQPQPSRRCGAMFLPETSLPVPAGVCIRWPGAGVLHVRR
ncbi:hypothetical protein HaLaN_12373, partial [Haematococcus lacustris]